MAIYHCPLCDQDQDGDVVDASAWAGEIACDSCIAEATESELEKYLADTELFHLCENVWYPPWGHNHDYIRGWLFGFAWRQDISAVGDDDGVYRELMFLTDIVSTRDYMEKFDA